GPQAGTASKTAPGHRLDVDRGHRPRLKASRPTGTRRDPGSGAEGGPFTPPGSHCRTLDARLGRARDRGRTGNAGQSRERREVQGFAKVGAPPSQSLRGTWNRSGGRIRARATRDRLKLVEPVFTSGAKAGGSTRPAWRCRPR